MDFGHLTFAAMWSLEIFDQWLCGPALIGMTLIRVAGVITAWRERTVAIGRRMNQQPVL